jgi:hypothetical protein
MEAGMRYSRYVMWVAGLVTLALSTPAASANDGRIVFSGAVVEPTCSGHDARAVRATVEERDVAAGPQRWTCGSPVATTYSQAVIPVDAVMQAGDPLLAYFAGYAGHLLPATPARVVVRTYE